jgi:hypothetical protein
MNDRPSKFTRDAITSSRKYAAFKTVDHEVYRLKFRPKFRAWERMQYSHLWRIVENGYGTEIGLAFSFALVMINGRNLQLLGDAIDRHCCDFVQEFDEAIHDKPADPKEPFVESIEITVETREQRVRASDKMIAEMSKPNPT